MATQGDHSMVRVSSVKTIDSGKQQLLQADGRHNERYGGEQADQGIPRIQSYGMSSHAPVGSQAMTMTMEGNPDMASVIGLEHPDHRPTGLQEGEIKYYEKWGGFIHAKEDKWEWKKDSAVIHVIKEGGVVHLNPPSQAEMDAMAAMEGPEDYAI